jgi:hypothetical protein
MATFCSIDPQHPNWRFFIIMVGGPKDHGHSVEKPGLEGSKKGGTPAESVWLRFTISVSVLAENGESGSEGEECEARWFGHGVEGLQGSDGESGSAVHCGGVGRG